MRSWSYRFCPWILLVFAASACANAPGGIDYAKGKGAITPDGLHRVLWEPFGVTFVKPGADLARYDKVLVQAVTISYKRPPRSTSLEDSSITPNFALSDSAVSSMKKYFHDVFVEALGESKDFKVTDSTGPDVLLISGHIENLEITAPPQSDEDGRETDYTQSSGQMTLVLDARDSESGEPLVRVGQTEAIQFADGGFYESDPITNSGAVQQMFRTWASDLVRELDQFHALPDLPPVPGRASYQATTK